MLFRFFSSLVPEFIKKQIQYLVQALSGYSPEIQRHQKDIEILNEKNLVLESQVDRLEAIVERLAAAAEKSVSGVTAQSVLDIKLNAVLPEGALIPQENIRFLVKEGFDRFPGGIYNPGFFSYQGKEFLLARGEKHMEIQRARDAEKMMRGSVPLLLERSDNGEARPIGELSLQGFPKNRCFRVEDFRTFTYQGLVYSHHSLIEFPPFFRHRNDKTYFSKQVLSRVHIEEKRLELIGQPVLDRDLAPAEKNWLFLPQGNDLYLFYAFAPDFVVQKLVSWKGLCFKTWIDQPLHILGLHRFPFISYSSNPVEYSDEHYLLFVHARRGKQVLDYLHWAVLIEKKTMKPAYISKKPVLRAGAARGVYSHVLFITAVKNCGDYFELIMGEGDYYASSAMLERNLLEKNLMPIHG